MPVDHGFWSSGEKEGQYNFGEKIALMHSELSEALEKHRVDMAKHGTVGSPDEHCPEHTGVAVEFADVIIRVFDLCGAMKIDIGRVVLDKMEYNRSRPIKHGKAY